MNALIDAVVAAVTAARYRTAEDVVAAQARASRRSNARRRDADTDESAA